MIVSHWLAAPPRPNVSNMRGSSKICSPPIVEVMMTKMSVGFSDGSVMLQNWRKAFAPSTVAAS